MDLAGCPKCGVVAVGHGRRQVRLHNIPCFGQPVGLLWAKRVWRCPDPDCPKTTFSEEHPLAGPWAKLTARAAHWATDALQRFDTSVLGPGPPARGFLAHRLGRHQSRSHPPIRNSDRLAGVEALGVDEHV
ncbi:transposase family protein [Pseudarthrobacter sp. YS3]|uniref:transposase family protein n=1 Tax=Pseudarthrobacter sp. YS3 TaxID=3453718 RepID=UPI003EE9CA6E